MPTEVHRTPHDYFLNNLALFIFTFCCVGYENLRSEMFSKLVMREFSPAADVFFYLFWQAFDLS